MTNPKPDTEKDSLYNNLELMSTAELLSNINQEDQKIPLIIQKAIPEIEKLIDAVVSKMQNGGRLFYIGAGTSGRLGILDASECPPTFGVPHDWVIGIIAGGEKAILKAVENAEDNTQQAWQDLLAHDINTNDFVVGIAASGNTPYVVGGLESATKNGVSTGSISCNANGLITQIADFPVTLVVGPEFLTGSTRMKAGTAQKLVLNMISTSAMIKLGRVKGNKMVDMQLTNKKLVKRGVSMIVEQLNIATETAEKLLLEHKSVRAVLNHYKSNF